MKRENIGNIIGLLLLLGCFAFALFKVFGRTRAEARGGEVIRFAHWQLEGGLRKAFDQLARDYEKLHPGVTIEQLAIPERTYAQWIQTQLIGGTATDILQLGRLSAGEDEMLARFFHPLSDLVEQPNPYNKGTALETTAWRNTFIDGLVGGFNYRPNLLEYYGVGMSMHTTRVYYNETLWKLILGDTPPPTDFDQFITICDRVRDYAKKTGAKVIPVAGSKANGPALIDKLAASQTQRLARTVLRNYSMKQDPAEIGISYLRGDWTLDTPAIEGALSIIRDVGLRLQPGYMSVTREDSAFYFVQSRALMIAAGSWDAPSFRQQAPFQIRVFNIPIPARTHPKYGANVYGPASEAATQVALSFGICRESPHRERAIDFLHYLTSQTANARFSQMSDWLPAIVDVDAPPFVQPFLPRTEGYVDGFGIGSIGANTKRILENANNNLVQAAGSIEEFKSIVAPRLPGAVRQDLARQVHIARLNIGRQDIILAASNELLSYLGADNKDLQRRIGETIEAQNQQEGTRAWIQSELDRRPTPAAHN
ncbi:extracellular solute-binding protein [Opitutaceae bacterium TAV4]|uniref:extracellular solute-binding protein n=1 Tax=Geminisphaera colitermitum TaxID=1148786 RepID=UPI0005BD5860|nr:extracellular solute-binding protein [Geminisphaera colitermitum]RRJ96340.1 extracellular solute-binding protein [Opitutaceae bacterium TAV4]RRK00481.1 extracellular solute-binding protein [Opitutaceae bacterium TAV3]